MAESTTTMEGQVSGQTARPSAGQQLREQTATVKEDLRELGRLTREASQEKLRQARDAASAYIEKGRQKAGEVEESVVRYVREKPVKSLLIAAGAGALLGFLVARRR